MHLGWENRSYNNCGIGRPKEEILNSLSKIGDKSILPSLIKLFLEGKFGNWDDREKRATINAIVTLSDGKASKWLLDFMKDEPKDELKNEPRVWAWGNDFKFFWLRKIVAQILGEIGDETALPILSDALCRVSKRLSRKRGRINSAFEEFNAISEALHHFGHPDACFYYERHDWHTGTGCHDDDAHGTSWTKMTRNKEQRL